jgi:GT2 family glycosyltransferase
VAIRKNRVRKQRKMVDQDQYINEVVALCDHRLSLISERENQIGNLTLLCKERLVRITELEQLCAVQGSTLLSQRYTLDKMRSALTWRATGFIRKGFGGAKRAFLPSTDCTLVPMAGLAPGEQPGSWQSVTDDPQFLIRLINENFYKLKNVWLSFKFASVNDGHIAELFFDVGAGFSPLLSLKFELSKGSNQLALPLPQGCIGIRFDPMMSQTDFTISDVKISKVVDSKYKCSDFLNAHREVNFIAQYNRDIVAHSPVNQLESSIVEIGAWESTGEDPFFILQHDNVVEGWNAFEVSITSPTKKVFSGKLYFDYGGGFNEADSENIIIKSSIIADRVIFIKDNLQCIRFDPMESKGSFQIDKLKISSVRVFNAKRLINKTLKLKKVDVAKSLSENYELYRDTFSPLTNAVDYHEWIERKEDPELLTREETVKEIDGFSLKPKISIVMPTYNTEEKFLRLCIDSVLNQHYSNIELCIADDNSPNKNVRKVLSKYAKKDDRIKLIFRPENGHISKATNSALELATGDYVALLDHDDELPLNAIYEVVKAINENPECNIIYSDEDKIDEEGNRFEPHFKSGWNPDLLYSQNYISHLGIYRKTLIDEIKGFRTGVEGSQDYDLLLRALKACDSKGVVHIPKVLYHWRAIAGSTALEEGEKSYTTDSGKKALEDYFSNVEGLKVSQGLHTNTYKVDWPIPENQPLVSLIIPTYNGYEITKQAIDSILEKTTYKNYEILLVDNNSNCPIALEYFESLDKLPNVTVLRYPYPFNYSAINNFAEKQAKGSVIGLINNDVEVISPNWLTELVSHALRPEIGCVGAKLYFENDTIQHGGVIVGLGGVAGHSHKHSKRDDPGYFRRLSLVQNFSAVTAAVLVIRKEVFDQVGGLNEVDLTVAFNDVDFCLKVMNAGYRNLWTPYAELYHYESISRGIEDNPVKIARFNSEMAYMKNTWGGGLLVDCYYNENLTLAREDFSLGG